MGERQWKIVEVERGVYEFINRNSNLVLDADQSNDNVLQYKSLNGVNQRWKVTGAGNGSYYIVNKANNRMLEVYYAETEDGVNVQHWGFNGETCQMWNVIPVDSQKVPIGVPHTTGRLSGIHKYTGRSIMFSGLSESRILSDRRLDLTGRFQSVNRRTHSGSGVFVIPEIHKNHKAMDKRNR